MNGFLDLQYNGTFRRLDTSDFVQSIWRFLKRSDMLLRMDTACVLERPAIEALSDVLVSEFGREVDNERLKQMIGDMVSKIMIARGFRVDQKDVRITRPNIFNVGIRYVLPDMPQRSVRLSKGMSLKEYLTKCAARDEFTRSLDKFLYETDGKISFARLTELAKKNGMQLLPGSQDADTKLRVTTALRAKLAGDPKQLAACIESCPPLQSDKVSDTLKARG